MGISYFSTCQPVNLSTGLIGQDVNILYQGIMGRPYLSTCGHFNLSTCLPGLTGSEVNIGVLVLMGILYSFNCRPVTCQPFYQG